MEQNSRSHESFLPQKFGAIWYTWNIIDHLTIIITQVFINDLILINQLWINFLQIKQQDDFECQHNNVLDLIMSMHACIDYLKYMLSDTALSVVIALSKARAQLPYPWFI